MSSANVEGHDTLSDSSNAYSRRMCSGLLPPVDDSKSETLLRVASHKQCEVIITPLVAMAMTSLLKDFYSDVSMSVLGKESTEMLSSECKHRFATRRSGPQSLENCQVKALNHNARDYT